MELQEIEITINKHGQVEVRVRGVKGEACLDITRPMEEALGAQVLLREMTPEAAEPPDHKIDDQQTLGQG
jgi:hypothetical protein